MIFQFFQQSIKMLNHPPDLTNPELDHDVTSDTKSYDGFCDDPPFYMRPLDQNSQDEPISILGQSTHLQVEPESEFISSQTEGTQLKSPSDDDSPSEKRCTQYIFKRISTIFKGLVRENQLSELIRKEPIHRSDFVLRALARLQNCQIYRTIVELFLERLATQIQAQQFKSFEVEATKKEIVLRQVLSRYHKAISVIQEDIKQWPHALGIIYREDNGLRRAGTLAKSRKSMKDLRKELGLNN